MPIVPFASDIIAAVVNQHFAVGQIAVPQEYLHFARCETFFDITKTCDLWLANVRLSNDRVELRIGEELVFRTLAAAAVPGLHNDYQNFLWLSGNAFRTVVTDVYVTCFSTPVPNAPVAADILSQWRAYAANGTGVCIHYRRDRVRQHAGNNLRINPVVYDEALHQRLITDTIACGYALFTSHQATVGEAAMATAQAFRYFLPLIKHPGFSEEREWRYIYTPMLVANPIPVSFLAAGDYKRDYVELSKIVAPPGGNPVATPLVPYKVTIGPAPDQQLLYDSVRCWLNENGIMAEIERSAIPYRG